VQILTRQRDRCAGKLSRRRSGCSTAPSAVSGLAPPQRRLCRAKVTHRGLRFRSRKAAESIGRAAPTSRRQWPKRQAGQEGQSPKSSAAVIIFAIIEVRNSDIMPVMVSISKNTAYVAHYRRHYNNRKLSAHNQIYCCQIRPVNL